MQPVTFLQGVLNEVRFGFKNIDEITHIYKETCVKTDKNFNQYMPKLLV